MNIPAVPYAAGSFIVGVIFMPVMFVCRTREQRRQDRLAQKSQEDARDHSAQRPGGLLLNAVRGFCMALADSVPGVSGGTVAFLLGFYDRFVISLDDLFTGKMERKKSALAFLLKLGIGWIAGMILAVTVLSSVFESHIYAVSSLFVGFIVFSIPLVIYEERDTLRSRPFAGLFVLLGAVIVIGISLIHPAGGQFGSGGLNFTGAAYVFLSGMVGITAMVLPGISGSTLLLIMGTYLPVINGLHSLLKLDFSAFPMLVSFGLGVLAGILLSIKLLRKAIERCRPQMIYLILGLMLGSLYAVFAGPATLDPPQPAMTLHTFQIVFFLAGGAVILALQGLKYAVEHRSKGKHNA